MWVRVFEEPWVGGVKRKDSERDGKRRWKSEGGERKRGDKCWEGGRRVCECRAASVGVSFREGARNSLCDTRSRRRHFLVRTAEMKVGILVAYKQYNNVGGVLCARAIWVLRRRGSWFKDSKIFLRLKDSREELPLTIAVLKLLGVHRELADEGGTRKEVVGVGGGGGSTRVIGRREGTQKKRKDGNVGRESKANKKPRRGFTPCEENGVGGCLVL